MIYTNYLNGTLQSDLAAILSSLPFYLIGAILAWIFTCLGHRIACSVFKINGGEMGVSYNPLKNVSLFSLLGVVAFPVLGVGWTKPTAFKAESRGKTLAIALAGPLFCFIISAVAVLVYPLTSVAFLGSLFMGIATAGVCFSIMNILPLPGLCGGVIIGAILPEKASEKWMGLSKYYPITVTLAALLLARSQVNTLVLTKVINFIGSLIG